MVLEKFLKDLVNGPEVKPVERVNTDIEPAVREPEAGTDFLPPNPDIPAKPAPGRTILDVLEDIATNTRQLVTPSPGIVWQPLEARIPVSAGELSLYGTEYVRFIYIPNVPRNMRVYSGSSKGLFLGDLTPGQSLQVELPYAVRGVYIEHDSGNGNDHFTVYLSSRKIDISITPAGAVWG